MAVNMISSEMNQEEKRNSEYPCVRALYDYEYSDAGRKVWMNEDEVFYLIEGVKDQDWWHVCRPDNKSLTFYVPSSYVERLEDGNVNTIDVDKGSTGHSVNDTYFNDTTHNRGLNHSNSYDGSIGNFGTFSTAKIQMDPQEGSEDYMNVGIQPYSSSSSFIGENKETFKVQYIQAKRPSDLQDINEGDYANLEDFRAAANLPSLNQPQSPPSPQTPEGDYANLGDLNMADQSPPPLEGCEYKKTLLDTWDMYLDPHTNRIFYVHKETKETQWKPPRGQFHQQMQLRKQRSRSSSEYEDIEDILAPLIMPMRGKSRSVDYGVPRVPSLKGKAPFGWKHTINTLGEDVYVNNDTQEEWIQTKDTYGRDYFYRCHSGTGESVWELPVKSGESSPTKSPTSENEERTIVTKPDLLPTPGLVSGPRLGQQVSDRFQKSRSVMLENLHLSSRLATTNTGPPPPKSATLPPNFCTPTFETQENQEGRKLSHTELQLSQSVQLNEPIEGLLNKCKLTNGKKGSKKWSVSYVKLTGTNLVFYKDQKSTIPKSGQPHGKSDQMLALRDCSLEKEPKDIGSKKKNMILVNSPDGQMILQSDDDAKIQEWFLKLHMKIQELGGNPDAVAPDTPSELLPQDMPSGLSKKPSFKGRHRRNPSDGGGTLERRGKVIDLLSKFMTNRSEKKELVKKGIYKDAVFGADLKLICEREKSKVPSFVVRALEAIEKRGLEHEGIYRIGGNISMIQKLRCMVDQGVPFDLHDQMWDIHILCGTLKLLFRELKEPLFTYSLFEKFLKSFLKESASERLKAIKSTVNELPKCHYETVKVLFKHLTNVTELSAQNKMQAHQLAIVFGPTLIWPEIQTQNLATSMVYQSRIVEFILLEYKNIFR